MITINGVSLTDGQVRQLLHRVFWKHTSASTNFWEGCHEAADAATAFLASLGRDGYEPTNVAELASYPRCTVHGVYLREKPCSACAEEAPKPPPRVHTPMGRPTPPQRKVLEHLDEGCHVNLFATNASWGGHPWCTEGPVWGHHHLIELHTWRALVRRGWVEEYERFDYPDDRGTPQANYRISEAGRAALQASHKGS